MDDATVSPEDLGEPERTRRIPIVGIGASAGGVDSLRRLLPGMEPGCGLAFVVVLHLHPEHESHLPEILARSCRLAVVAIEDGAAIEADHVYVLPARAGVTIAGGHLRLSPPAPRGLAIAIDDFFSSLAAEQGEEAACVILSGTGSDGTVGLRSIKEAGGLTIAESGAQYDGMMRSAVATGLVDFVLPAEEMAAKLDGYFRHVTRLGAADRQTQVAPPDLLSRIAAILRGQTGHDFSEYKDRTIIRRVQRRMHVLQLDDVAAFVERLRQDPREVTLLFQDLLIGVTDFFRDPATFEAVEHAVIPDLFRGRGANDTIRIWVPGCSTGEEAYTLAMLLREGAPRDQPGPRLQVFASDIDDRALETARLGRYPDGIAKHVTPQRLERFFAREDGTWRANAELREMCLFASHNLLRDAPFSRLDMISCRNMLIYLSGDLQNRVIPLFHYALNPNGYLLLGTSENVTRHSRLFVTVDKTHRLFQRRAYLERTLPDFPLTAPDPTRRRLPDRAARAPAILPSLRAAAERQLLDRFAPAYAVINGEGDLLQSSGRTGKYLELPPGAPDTNIFSLARGALRLDLRALVHRAAATGQIAAQHGVTVGANGGAQDIDLFVQPLPPAGGDEPLFMVVFQDVGGIRPEVFGRRGDAEPIASDALQQIERELRTTRERLETATEELESSNEELKSSNEELSSINEELQSTNEELETSKEELQSINEELQTVNAELSARVDELSRANNDMANLLESTQIATVFLDRNLLVKGFTPAAKDVFRLVESDAGRPILHVRPLFELDSLQADAERVLRTLGTIERPVSNHATGSRYVMRLLPYRTADNVIGGVVLTFTDITRIAAAEARIEELTLALQARVKDLETLLDLIPVGVMIADATADPAVFINQYGARLIGATDDAPGLRPAVAPIRLFDGDRLLPPEEQPLLVAASTGKPTALLEARLEGPDGKSTHAMVSAAPFLDERRLPRGAVAAVIDISRHKRSEAEQLVLLNELQHRVKNILATVGSLAARIGRSSESIAEFQGSFLSRLSAMGNIHDLLSSGSWQSADLGLLLRTIFELHTNGRDRSISLHGEAVALPPGVAPTLGMVFYELATNAVKYGALAVPDGVVAVSWTVEARQATGERTLHLVWNEQDGPPVQAGGPEGFGTSFIRRSVEYELDGIVTLDMADAGVRCAIEFTIPGNPDLLGA